MRVAYIELPDGNKLISYYRHDCKSVIIDGKYYMIDGGQGDDYVRCSGDVKFMELADIIESIRNEYKMNHVILKEVTTVTIKEFIKYSKALDKVFAPNGLKTLDFPMVIMKAELKYRKNNNII